MHGFFADLIAQIGVPELEEQLLATVEAELAKNVASSGCGMSLRDAPARSTSCRDGRRPAASSVDGIDVAVVRDGDEVFAIEDVCSHAASR